MSNHVHAKPKKPLLIRRYGKWDLNTKPHVSEDQKVVYKLGYDTSFGPIGNIKDILAPQIRPRSGKDRFFANNEPYFHATMERDYQ